jgi:hypothetical protein
MSLRSTVLDFGSFPVDWLLLESKSSGQNSTVLQELVFQCPATLTGGEKRVKW